MSRSSPADPSVLKKDIAAGRVAPVYLLYGEAGFLKEEAVAALREAVLGNGPAPESAWNLTLLEGPSAGIAEILDSARTLPMLGSRRLVMVKNAEKLREGDSEPLRTYLQRPSPSSCLVFVTGTGKPDFRRSLFRTLQAGAVAIEFKPLREPAVPRWIRERVRERGAEIDDEALTLLEVHLGVDLLRIDQEITKALDFLSPSRRVTSAALAETLGAPGSRSIFELAEKVGAGETGEAIRLLRRLLAGGEEPVRLLGLIARQIRTLILGKALMEGGRRGRELALALGVPPIPPLIEKTQRLIGRFPARVGAASMRRILQADRALKGGAGKGPAILEGLVLDLSERIGRSVRRGETRA
ncbi:MAG TPA: DNA polymerase III subunit delta [Candidatus Polarisedimenticolia bacterium]|nr:DNA polymerase III subunit delta [Candidatus Polarisedimenticolia bacterium]